MKRLALPFAIVFLLAVTGTAQRGGGGHSAGDGAPASLPAPGVVTAPGGLVVNVSEPTAGAPCAGVAHVRVAVVIKAMANLRNRANIAGLVVAEVKAGSALVVEKEDGPGSPWYMVTEVATGRRGWAHGNAIKIAYER